MPKIIDPDDLVMASSSGQVGTDGNIFIDYTNSEIYLAEYDLLTEDGVTLQCLYTFFAKYMDFSNTSALYDWPYRVITAKQMRLQNGWDFANETTRLLIRDGGVQVVDANGNPTREDFGLVTQGDFVDSTDQAYYQVEDGAAPIDFNLDDKVNQMVKVYEVLATHSPSAGYTITGGNTITADDGDFTLTFSAGDQIEIRDSVLGNNGVYTVDTVVALTITLIESTLSNGDDDSIAVLKVNDYRGYFKIFLREQGKKYDFFDLVQSGLEGSDITYERITAPLSNESDPKVTEPDVTVDAYGVTISWYATGQTRNISGTDYTFSIIIDGNNKTAEEIYMAVQSLLRKPVGTDINNNTGSTGPRRGVITPELLRFVGDDLFTLYDSDNNQGVYIDNFNLDDINRLYFRDDSNVERSFDYVATVNLLMNPALVNDPEAKYWVVFQDAGGNLFGTSNAIIVDQDSGEEVELTNGFTFGTNTITAASGLDVFNDGDKILVQGSASEDNLYTITGTPTATTITVVETLGNSGLDSGTVKVTSKKMCGYVAGRSSIAQDFNYDNNTQGGRASGQNANVFLVARGHAGAQYFKGSATIYRQTGQNFQYFAPEELVFLDPA